MIFKNYSYFISILNKENVKFNYNLINKNSSTFRIFKNMEYVEHENIEKIDLYVKTIIHNKFFTVFEKLEISDGLIHTIIHKY